MTAEMTTKRQPTTHLCEVCGVNPVVSVHNAPNGAWSIGYCSECLKQDAEPVWYFEQVWTDNDGIAIPMSVVMAKTFVDGDYLTWNEWVVKYKRPVTPTPPRTGTAESRIVEQDTPAQSSPFGKSSDGPVQTSFGHPPTRLGQPETITVPVISYQRYQDMGRTTIELFVRIPGQDGTEKVIVSAGDDIGQGLLRSMGIYYELMSPQMPSREFLFEAGIQKGTISRKWVLKEVRPTRKSWVETDLPKFVDNVTPLVIQKRGKFDLRDLCVSVLQCPLQQFVTANEAIQTTLEVLATLPDSEMTMAFPRDKNNQPVDDSEAAKVQAVNIELAELVDDEQPSQPDKKVEQPAAKKTAKNAWIENKAQRGAYFAIVGALVREFLGIALKEAEAYSQQAHKVDSHYDITLDQPGAIKVVTTQIMRDLYQRDLGRPMNVGDFQRAVGFGKYEAAQAGGLTDKEMLVFVRDDIALEKAVNAQQTKTFTDSVSPDESDSPNVKDIQSFSEKSNQKVANLDENVIQVDTSTSPANNNPVAPVFEKEIVIPQSKPQTMALVPTGESRWDVMVQQANVMLKSGFLPSSIKTPEQALTIAMMGEALGIAAIVAINNINVIQGKPTVSPQLMLALVRRSGQLEDMKVTDDGQTCTVTVKRKSESAHVETFSMEDARNMQLAGKDNWRKQPAVMRKWRCIAAACRVMFSDIIWGLYTTEEIDPDYNVTEAA